MQQPHTGQSVPHSAMARQIATEPHPALVNSIIVSPLAHRAPTAARDTIGSPRREASFALATMVTPHTLGVNHDRLMAQLRASLHNPASVVSRQAMRDGYGSRLALLSQSSSDSTPPSPNTHSSTNWSPRRSASHASARTLRPIDSFLPPQPLRTSSSLGLAHVDSGDLSLSDHDDETAVARNKKKPVEVCVPRLLWRLWYVVLLFHCGQLRGRTLCLLPPDHWLRRHLEAIIYHPQFDNGILVLIVLASILLAVDTPLLDPDSGLATGLMYADLVITALFLFEAAAKIMVLGFIANKVACCVTCVRESQWCNSLVQPRDRT